MVDNQDLTKYFIYDIIILLMDGGIFINNNQSPQSRLGKFTAFH